MGTGGEHRGGAGGSGKSWREMVEASPEIWQSKFGICMVKNEWLKILLELLLYFKVNVFRYTC